MLENIMQLIQNENTEEASKILNTLTKVCQDIGTIEPSDMRFLHSPIQFHQAGWFLQIVKQNKSMKFFSNSFNKNVEFIKYILTFKFYNH